MGKPRSPIRRVVGLGTVVFAMRGVAGSADSWAFLLSLGRPVGTGSILNDGLFR
jgi:hypothetical protein